MHTWCTHAQTETNRDNQRQTDRHHAYICKHANMHTCLDTVVWIRAHIHTCTYAQIQLCTYAQWTHMHKQKQTDTNRDKQIQTETDRDQETKISNIGNKDQQQSRAKTSSDKLRPTETRRNNTDNKEEQQSRANEKQGQTETNRDKEGPRETTHTTKKDNEICAWVRLLYPDTCAYVHGVCLSVFLCLLCALLCCGRSSLSVLFVWSLLVSVCLVSFCLSLSFVILGWCRSSLSVLFLGLLVDIISLAEGAKGVPNKLLNICYSCLQLITYLCVYVHMCMCACVSSSVHVWDQSIEQ